MMQADADVQRIAILTYPGCFFGEVIQLLEMLTSLRDSMVVPDQGNKRNLVHLYSLTGERLFSPSSRLIYMDTRMIQGAKPLQTDLLIIANGAWPVEEPAESVSGWLRATCPGAKQIVALGSGVLRLASAGLLNHRIVTTHSAAAASLAEHYPLVCVDALMSLQIDGNIFTTNEHINLRELAMLLIRRALIHNRRPIYPYTMPQSSAGVAPGDPILIQPDSIAHRVILWWLAHVGEDISMERSAAFLSMSERSFRRHFKLEVGYPPYLFLLLLRLELARQALVDSQLPIDKIARRGGLHDGQQLARMFRKFIVTSPHQYRSEKSRGGLSMPHTAYAALFDGCSTPLWLRELQFAAQGQVQPV
ncbi:helix-turn-helix domain-containing protein [Acerihabitans sp. TG2]|uniref:helix-turn-helix domain-containing protein n=1 Tax=Acerihabitans sp. TG2 TaxID=3096008 RepID=UPI002B23C213|nr:helix-turn-helix domain-containing protein [Acerihabitans sp. TG2]MEA9389716.1 helix-turn-helix domain-containing protein [Acerihabitans sp. TG2]